VGEGQDHYIKGGKKKDNESSPGSNCLVSREKKQMLFICTGEKEIPAEAQRPPNKTDVRRSGDKGEKRLR